ncbi:cilia- and flagella-associated protein 61 [Megalops cyprinoides]|uniref:cilia- and flagella-associated protein 61 n=1 Tax=Megalops cyprinoides TaxID=118141 RepID=UPI001864643F|nr:cilia- and flagella-associated protein 61 [Megalops cyprinoides]
MRTVSAWSGEVETVTVRRTESADAREISDLIAPATEAVFGRVNVIYLLEKANLAVTLTNEKNAVLAHAAFLDHPGTDLVDPAEWEPWLHRHFSTDKCTPLNTLFLHLFVAQPDFSLGSAKEIVRTVFSAITELHYIFLVIPNSACLEPALLEIFEPVKRLQDPESQCTAFVCHRHNFCPTLHIRRARVEDHDDLMLIVAEQTKVSCATYGPYFLAELIEAQDDDVHAAVCENEGTAVGFISVSGDVNVKLLNECFELGPFNGLCKTVESPEDTEDTSQQTPGEKVQYHCDTSQKLSATDQLNEAATPEPGQEAPNAFCIQLFFINKKYEMRSVDFLPYIFSLFPDRDFCVITVPKLTPEFPLLQAFLRVVPVSTSTLPQELYLYHRSGLLKSFEVRVAVSSDRPAIESLVKQLTLHESMLEDLDMFCQARQDTDRTALQAFVAQVLGQVVGIVIIRNEEDIDYIRAHYNIENFIYFSHHQREEHGQLCHFALNPVFQHYAKHFLKEALRLAHKSCLYYPVYPSYHSQKNASAHSLTSALSCMAPVRPRRQIVYPLEELGLNAPSQRITAEQTPYAINHINRKLTLEPKVTVNARIVVVGASDTGIAFLEVFAFCPHLRFNNLTLISTHGFSAYYTDENTRFLATSHSYDNKDHAQLSLRSWVNVIVGKMTGINRADKHVVVYGGRRVPYDHLILCTGTQYQVPCPTGADVSQPTTNGDVTAQPHQRYPGPLPSNLLTLNDTHDCLEAHRWLQENFVDLEGNAVVYGNSLDVYTCVETLLRLGISGSRVHVVHLPDDPGVTCFSSPVVAKAVSEALGRNGVHVYSNCVLAQMNDGQDPEPLTSVSFTTDRAPLRLQCSVFINFSRKGVDYDAFKSINDACLVFDGRLVIDTAFHTNDPTIRAAGPLTKFARRYHADRWSHADFCSKEVGAELAAVMLPLFDPTLEPEEGTPSDLDNLIPVYSHAKIEGGRLPGGYSYLHAVKPALNPPCNLYWLPRSSQGREVVTGTAMTGDYFHLYLNQYGLVESITCLSLKPLPASNYLCLYGKHELLLNRLCGRFEEGLIRDLYSYFNEPWCLAIYHDRFADFEEEVRQIMESAKVQGDDDLLSMSEIIQKMVEDPVGSEDPYVHLQNVFEKSDGLTHLKKGVLNYLKYNRYHLPMYAQPETM